MKATLVNAAVLLLAVAASGVLSGSAAAQYDATEVGPARGRLVLWLAVTSWPGLRDLEPAAGGSFDQIGLGIGGAAHWPIRRLGNGELMLGIEGAFTGTEGSVPVYFDDIMARDGYLGVSAKWMMAKPRGVSLDAGLGYHLLDIAQLDSNYYAYVEFQSWEDSAVGPFIGINWDVGASRPDADRGLSLGLRAHILDFGTVRDEDILFAPVLGADAGDLDGPVFELQIGYRWR